MTTSNSALAYSNSDLNEITGSSCLRLGRGKYKSLRRNLDSVNNLSLNDENETKNKFTNSYILNDYFELKLIELLRSEPFEDGFNNNCDEYVNLNLIKNPTATKRTLLNIFYNYINDIEIAGGIVRIISKFKKNQLYPEGDFILISALNHEAEEIVDYGIRVFEIWKSIEHITILDSIEINMKPGWLKDYLSKVIYVYKLKHGIVN